MVSPYQLRLGAKWFCHPTEEFIFNKKDQLFKHNHTANIEILSYFSKVVQEKC